MIPRDRMNTTKQDQKRDKTDITELKTTCIIITNHTAGNQKIGEDFL